eukprot:TRINITY_DN12331_c0_g1_i1.p1 TRINITY_DN12331_c0_g1~~TRINITY_DN12331_c0_g1_i1.p1  ORF type:complete len:472 (-),score=105.41 TRINITY_DN12331_c0_g1_i1:123-1538(-)
MSRPPPRSTLSSSSAASDVYKRQVFGVLSRTQARLLTAYDGGGAELRGEMLTDTEQGEQLAESLFCLFPHKCVGPEDLVHGLRLAHSILTGSPEHRGLFTRMRMLNPYKRLIALLSSAEDNRIVRYASEMYASMLWPGVGHGEPGSTQHADELAGFCLNNLFSASCPAELACAVIGAVKTLLREPRLRAHLSCTYSLHRELPLVLSRYTAMPQSGVGEAEAGRPKGVLIELVYKLTFCLWLLSYHEEALQGLTHTDIVPAALLLMSRVPRVKVVRVCARLLRNLVTHPAHCQALLDQGALRLMAMLVGRPCEDEELMDDLGTVLGVLASQVQALSSLQMYTEQLLEGRYEWNALRLSSSFFRENARAMADRPSGHSESVIQLLARRLREQLIDGDLAAAGVLCHDIGQFAQWHPQGRRLIEVDRGEGGSTKEVLVWLIGHPDKELACQALKASQRVLCASWHALEEQRPAS